MLGYHSPPRTLPSSRHNSTIGFQPWLLDSWVIRTLFTSPYSALSFYCRGGSWLTRRFTVWFWQTYYVGFLNSGYSHIWKWSFHKKLRPKGIKTSVKLHYFSMTRHHKHERLTCNSTAELLFPSLFFIWSMSSANAWDCLNTFQMITIHKSHNFPMLLQRSSKLPCLDTGKSL